MEDQDIKYMRIKGNPIGDFWDDIDYLTSRSNEDTGYPTQKPLALLERIIKASSKEGDLVLDLIFRPYKRKV